MQALKWARHSWNRAGLWLWLLGSLPTATGQESGLRIAKLRYRGGGDWYANKTALPNLIRFCNEKIGTQLHRSQSVVAVGDEALFSYPFVYMTGHGHVLFNEKEVRNLRKYLLNGGFLHIDDNYGMDPFIRREMKKVFPALPFVAVPFSHPVYHQKFSFPHGLPKVHAHDGHPPQGLGIFYEGKLVCFYSYESDLGNGWEDATIHGNPQPTRQAALQMGANLIMYAFSGEN